MMFEATEKLEGSSMTVYQLKGEFGVCSRNMDLKESEGNAFWATARKDDIEAKMRAVDEFWDFAIQGELIGPGIQGNIYKLSQPEFRVFDVYDIMKGEYLLPEARRELIHKMGLKHVPVLTPYFPLDATVDELLAMAEFKSELASVEREGVVFKQNDGGMTFKAISNKYLLKSGD
jgi:RNA ligase (TIGR02306 family)